MQRNINELNSRKQALSRNENKAGVMATEVNLLYRREKLVQLLTNF